MHLQHFQEAVRRLHCLDYHDLVIIGAFTPEQNDWSDFRTNPAQWVISSDSDRVAKVWALINKRPFASVTDEHDGN